MDKTAANAPLAAAPVAMTMGDPSGIGPEIALKAWMSSRQQGSPFFLIADPAHIGRLARSSGLDVPVQTIDEGDLRDAITHIFPKAFPVLPVGHAVDGQPGIVSTEDARPTIASIEKAVQLVSTGAASALVTNPITKDALYRSGFAHPGHTEFLGELAQRYYGVHVHPVMMLWCEELAVVPVTIHISLKKVLSGLTRELIVETARITAFDLRTKFGIAQPRLAISGLNPHAGENGSMGSEDRDIIAPAVADLIAEGIQARGPLPADTMFHAAARKTYDAAICMYHDQALIPIKTIAFDSGVNITLGLPFIRTSPDHGTAYDIAGKGIARADSLLASLALATRLVRAPMDKAA